MQTIYLHHALTHYLVGTVLTGMSGQLFSYVHVPSSDFLLVSQEAQGECALSLTDRSDTVSLRKH